MKVMHVGCNSRQLTGRNVVMARFKARHFELIDIIDQFEAKPSSTHCRNALGAIWRLKDDGREFWQDGSQQLRRWQGYCDSLLDFLSSLDGRRSIQEQGLETAMREFIQEFEHSTAGMYEMLYGTAQDPDGNTDVQRMLDWFALVYRLFTYAIVSTWIDDKTESVYHETTMHISRDTMTTDTRTTVIPMKIPRKYRRSAKSY